MISAREHVERMSRVKGKRGKDGAVSLSLGGMKTAPRTGQFLAMRCRFCGGIIGRIDTEAGPNASATGKCCGETYAASVCVDGDTVRMYQPALSPDDFFDEATP